MRFFYADKISVATAAIAMHMNEQGVGETPSNPARVFSIAGWVVDPPIGRISRGDVTAQLEPKVMEVLEYLACRPGQVVSREELEAAVWRSRVVSYDAVTNAIIKLRKAFKDDPRHPQIIETLSKRGYRLVAPVGQLEERTETTETANHDRARAQTRNRWIRVGAATALVVLVAVVGALFWQSPWKATVGTGGDPARLKSIAVLPFDNLSGDRDQDYFADGMTDDLITGLAKNPDLLVIARDSAFVYKDQRLNVRQVAERLNVRFVLHGSVRRVGWRVRINAQLIEAASGAHLWAERYDGEMDAVLNMQDKITQSIISALAVKVGGGERQDLGAPLTHSAEAYDHFLRGRQHFYLYLNRAENKKARELFHKAIQSDPSFAMAYAMLAWTHVFDAMNGWSDKPEQSLGDANDSATKAISLQKALPVAYFVTGLAYRERGEYVKALVEAEKAIQYDPNYANAHVLLATLLYYAGRPQEGLERIQKAIQLNPHHPYNYSFHLGQAYYILRRYDEAIEAFKRGIESNPTSERLHVWLAAAYAQSGAIEEARWEATQVLTLNPGFSRVRIQKTFPFKNPADREHFLDGLRKAGLAQ